MTLQNSTAIIDLLKKHNHQLDSSQKGDHIFSLRTSKAEKNKNITTTGIHDVMMVYPTGVTKVSFGRVQKWFYIRD